MSESRLDALILGHTGQDGILLREQLQAEGRSWIGLSGSEASVSDGREFPWHAIADRDAVRRCIGHYRPKEIYYLSAAHSGSSAGPSHELGARYRLEIAVNTLGVVQHLEAIRDLSPDTRFLYASSSLVFAPTASPAERITEEQQFAPAEPYALQKALGGLACRDFRDQHGVFACVAYLFNHESIHRRSGYFTSQVVAGIRRVLQGEEDSLEVGNLDAIVDWSYAGDVVTAMRRAVAAEAPQDYVVASGVPHTIRDFLHVAFDHVGLELDGNIRVNPALLRRTNSCRIGDSSRLRRVTGWEATMSFENLVRHLLDKRP